MCFELIFSCAFNMNAVYGAVFGKAVQWGVKRGIFSNEAGQGTGAQASGAAEVSHPAKQGLVQAFSVYVDTLLVCSATAVMILVTNSFNVADPVNQGGFILQQIQGVQASNFTQVAVNSLVPNAGGAFVAVALFFFTFTTVLAYAFYTDSSISYLFKNNAQGPGFNGAIHFFPSGGGRLVLHRCDQFGRCRVEFRFCCRRCHGLVQYRGHPAARQTGNCDPEGL